MAAGASLQCVPATAPERPRASLHGRGHAAPSPLDARGGIHYSAFTRGVEQAKSSRPAFRLRIQPHPFHPPCMPDVHTFTPRRSEARTESLVAAILAAALVVAYLYVGRGERDVRLLAGFSTFAAALILAGYLMRSSFQWVDEIQLSDDAATLVRNGSPQTLPWAQVKSVRHFTRGGEQWVLASNRGYLPMTIRADGLNREEAARLRELIPALHAAAQVAESTAR
jgi:hypothetical protein